MATLPILAPRLPGCKPLADEKAYPKEHSEDEWETMRDIIQRLYIYDNRKLNETMAILHTRHGFAATEQMYKKRLKKWNFRKRTYRKSPCGSNASTPAYPVATPRMSISEIQHSPEDLESDQSSMSLIQPSNVGPFAGLEQVLGNVFTWSQAKLDSHHVDSDPMSRYLAHPNHPPIQDSRTMYRTFELVFDLWNHGKGSLAGMAARRGFYCLEFVLTDDHPDLIWHVLDTIYDMVDRGHLQLLRMFLEHANILAHRQLPAQHPLLRILQQLRQCDYQTDEGRQYVCQLLRLAWLRNVDLLAEHIGSSIPQRLWLYEQLIWDGRTRLRKGSELARKQDAMNNALETLAAKEEEEAHEDASDRLRIEALMLEFTQMDLGDKEKAEQLAWKLLEHTESGSAPLASARFHAYARKMLARIHEDRQDWDTAEDNYRLAISKREAAHGTNNNLRVIRDMWVLAAHFQKAGKVDEAQKITADALSRAQHYLTEESA
ncbi:Fc.00g066920.m01.CDS01 [Cosmosporella sp. VM-42]